MFEVMRSCVALLLVVGCGSSATKPADPKDAERAARDARDKEIEAMKPADPYELRDRIVYRPSDRCGQGPYRIQGEALRAKYGERASIYACGKHAISGSYAITTLRDKQAPYSSNESSFGSSFDNEACKGRETAVTSGGPGGGGTTSGGGTAVRGKGGGTAVSPSTIKPVALVKEQGATVPENCERTHFIDYGWTSADDSVALDGGFTIDLWSEEPNDFEGLVFVIERHAVVSDMTLDRWKKFKADSDAWYAVYKANLDLNVRAGHVTLGEWKVKTPPPPPPRAEAQPPRPSKNARWIPGYWLYAETKFHWITGLWDVPEEDIKRELTVEAPKPPPAEPVRIEPPKEPQPTRTAVWTPGNWQWDGRVYVWVEGAWRIPPDADHTWQRPTWNVNAGRARFVPGGWKIRVRLGR